MGAQKSVPLYIKILIGMCLGLVVGYIATKVGWSDYISQWITPFGIIFMRLLKCIAVPLILLSLIGGVTSVGDFSTLSKIGVRAIALYVITTVCSVIIGLVLVYAINPGSVVDASSVASIKQAYSSSASTVISSTEVQSQSGPLDWLVKLIPENFIFAFSSNSDMLQIIVIAITLGVAIIMAGAKAKLFLDVVNSMNEVMLKVIDIIMSFAPIGVFALMADIFVQSSGNMDIVAALGLYVVTVLVGMAILVWVFYPVLVKLFTNYPPLKFIKKIFPVQILAFTTSSSAAVLPLNMEVTQRDLKVSTQTTSFVLPVGMTINMNGTSLYQAIGAVFIAEVLGIDLTFTQLLIIILTTTVSAIGTPGIPGGSIVILVMVLSSVGIPAEGLALILGVDRPLDMVRTIANVTGDATVAMIVDKRVNPEAHKEE